MRVWVATLVVSDATEQKITQKHHIRLDELEHAIVCVPGLRGTWHSHPTRGRRVLIEAFIRGRRILVVLYPTSRPDEWNLGSAYFI